MTKYQGFITWNTYTELCNLLDSLKDFRGIRNSLDHMWSPDTDMDDKICEDFNYIKSSVVRRLMEKYNKTLTLALNIAKLKKEENKK